MATEKLCQDRNCVETCDKNNLTWFGVGCDFYPTRWVFSISSTRLWDRHQTRWIKIISNPKPREILYLFKAETPKRSSNLPFSLCKVYAQIDKKKTLCTVQLIQQMRREHQTTRNGFGSFHLSWCLSRVHLLAFFSSIADEKVSLCFI